MLMPARTPLRATRARIAPGFLTPPAHAPQSAIAASAISDCVVNSTLRRSKRSAIDPASGPSSITGMNWVKVARPTQNALSVSW